MNPKIPHYDHFPHEMHLKDFKKAFEKLGFTFKTGTNHYQITHCNAQKCHVLSLNTKKIDKENLARLIKHAIQVTGDKLKVHQAVWDYEQ